MHASVNVDLLVQCPSQWCEGTLQNRAKLNHEKKICEFSSLCKTGRGVLAISHGLNYIKTTVQKGGWLLEA